MIDPVGQAELGQGAGAVPPAGDGEAAALGDRLGDRPGPGGKTRILEDTHGPVPKHGARPGDLVSEGGCRSGANVEADPPLRETDTELAHFTRRLLPGPELPARGQGGEIGRQQDALAALQQ
jgi:hypothetical protein